MDILDIQQDAIKRKEFMKFIAQQKEKKKKEQLMALKHSSKEQKK